MQAKMANEGRQPEQSPAPAQRPRILNVMGFPWLILIFAIPLIFPDWFFRTPRDDSVGNETLIGIASVGAVVWTGGLIAFQLRQLSSEVAASLSLLRFAFLVPLIALVSNGSTLRAVASLFGFYMLRASFGSGVVFLVLRFIIYLVSLEKFRKDVDAKLPRVLEIAAPELAVSVIADLILLAGYLAVFIYPSHLVIAVTATIFIFSGVQYIAVVLKPGYEEKLESLKAEIAALKGTTA